MASQYRLDASRANLPDVSLFVVEEGRRHLTISQLTDEQRKALEALFSLFDVDGNGFIEEAELEAAYNKLGLTCAPPALRQHIAQVDLSRSRDGKVEFKEFAAGVLHNNSHIFHCIYGKDPALLAAGVTRLAAAAKDVAVAFHEDDGDDDEELQPPFLCQPPDVFLPPTLSVTIKSASGIGGQHRKSSTSDGARGPALAGLFSGLKGYVLVEPPHHEQPLATFQTQKTKSKAGFIAWDETTDFTLDGSRGIFSKNVSLVLMATASLGKDKVVGRASVPMSIFKHQEGPQQPREFALELIPENNKSPTNPTLGVEVRYDDARRWWMSRELAARAAQKARRPTIAIPSMSLMGKKSSGSDRRCCAIL